MLEQPLDVEPWFHCSSCGATLMMLGEEGFALHFEEQGGACPKCSKKVDLWPVMLEAVRNNFMLTGAYVVVGANAKLAETEGRRYRHEPRLHNSGPPVPRRGPSN